MGYTTDFAGEFTITPALTPDQVEYLQAFNDTRRVKRDATLVAELNDPVRDAVGLPVGEDGAYYVGDRNAGRIFLNGETAPANDDKATIQATILDHNHPPGYVKVSDNWRTDYDTEQRRIINGDQQPGLWCQWTVSDDGTTLMWDEGEKFYAYVEWLRYIVDHFLSVWGCTLEGEVTWQGEEPEDTGIIECQPSQETPGQTCIDVRKGRIEYGEPVAY